MDKYLRQNQTFSNEFSYFGANTGYFIKWPLIPDERLENDGEPFLNDCKPYETRLRPWYTGAISGQKKMIIMVTSFI